MSAIKIHLDAAELNPVVRLAQTLKVTPEDIAYAALNRMMLEARTPETQSEIINLARAKAKNLPRWADSAGSVHAYEGMHDCEPERSKYSV